MVFTLLNLIYPNLIYFAVSLDLFFGQAHGPGRLLRPCQGFREKLRDGEDGRAAGNPLLNSGRISLYQIPSVSAVLCFYLNIQNSESERERQKDRNAERQREKNV